MLAGTHCRAGMAAGAAVVGGACALMFCGMHLDTLGALLIGAAAVEAFALNRHRQPRLVVMALAGLVAHLGKLALKVIALLAGARLNTAGLPLAETLALYAAFGLVAGGLAWALLRGADALHASTRQVP